MSVDTLINLQVSGEPKPKVSWQKDCTDVCETEGTTVLTDDLGSHLEIQELSHGLDGKFTVTAANPAGRTTKSFQVQMIEDVDVFEAYKSFSK